MAITGRDPITKSAPEPNYVIAAPAELGNYKIADSSAGSGTLPMSGFGWNFAGGLVMGAGSRWPAGTAGAGAQRSARYALCAATMTPSASFHRTSTAWKPLV